jgi:hypothetical protein
MNVHREQQWQLQLMQQRANVDALSDEVEQLRARIVELRESRDLARRVAMRLEEENHALAGGVCALCNQVLVPVPVVGEAR